MTKLVFALELLFLVMTYHNFQFKRYTLKLLLIFRSFKSGLYFFLLKKFYCLIQLGVLICNSNVSDNF